MKSIKARLILEIVICLVQLCFWCGLCLSVFVFFFLWIIVFLFVILSFGHLSPVLLRFMASDYPFGIVRLFFLCLNSILQLLRLITTINGI